MTLPRAHSLRTDLFAVGRQESRFAAMPSAELVTFPPTSIRSVRHGRSAYDSDGADGPRLARQSPTMTDIELSDMQALLHDSIVRWHAIVVAAGTICGLAGFSARGLTLLRALVQPPPLRRPKPSS
jgi:hypothetical protein